MSSHPPLSILPNRLLMGTGKISWFGGPNDSEDNGETASGFSTKDHPYSPYCSLPEEYWQQYGLNAYQEVTVEYAGMQVECFLADKGPGGTPDADERLIDVGYYVMKRLGCDTDSTVRIYIPLGRIVELCKRI